MNSQARIRILLVIAMATLLPACASKSPTSVNANDAADHALPAEVIVHRVKSGDRLSDIAKRYTGIAENWRKIAAYNEISNPRKLRVGATIEIPMELTPGYTAVPKKAIQKTVPTALAIQRPAQTEDKQADVDVVIQPVDDNRNFELKPLETSAQTQVVTESVYVKVVGSYYPKGVYSQPAPYSRLLLRVAPGTLFKFERQVNDWYKVNTDKGDGYIRLVDGLILD